MSSQPQEKNSFLTNLKHDLPASVVVFLVALPLCMGIAIASGVPVAAGLITGIVGGLVVGLLSGSPLQVSGPAAGLTVIVYQFIQEHGIEKLGIVVLAAGLLQLVAGLLRLGQWFRAVSPAVIQGMLAGIGVLILASQFHVMVDDKPKQSGLKNLVTIPEAIQKGFPLPELLEDGKSERRQRRELLQQLGPLHLAQTELAVEVHHLVVGIPAEKSESGAKPARSAEEVAPRLEALVPRQVAIVEALRGIQNPVEPDELQAAIRASESALADLEAGRVTEVRASQDVAVAAIGEHLNALKHHRWAAAVGLLTILTLLAWSSLIPQRLRLVPAPLVAVVVGAGASVLLGLPILSVEVPNNLLDGIAFPTLTDFRGLLDAGLLLAAVEIAVIASAETLLCATAVDQLHRGPRTRYDRELAAQGIGNTVCGFFSALPMTGVIVRSSANVAAGARTRMSAVLHGLWLLTFVSSLAFLLRLIPTASLAAILVYTGYKLVNPKAIGKLWQYGKGEVAIYVVTVGTIVATDLLIGVLTGIGLSIAKLLYTFAHLKIRIEEDRAANRTTLELIGAATFLRLPKLAAALEKIPAGTELHVRFDRLDYIDHACLDLLMNWEKQHSATGGALHIDWESLTGRFRRELQDSVVNKPHTKVAAVG